MEAELIALTDNLGLIKLIELFWGIFGVHDPECHSSPSDLSRL
jgi:hypothetical protein